MDTIPFERENLAVHVDLCAQRYEALDTRLTNVEKKLSTLQDTLEKSHKDTVKVLIGTAGTVIVGISGLIATILTKL